MSEFNDEISQETPKRTIAKISLSKKSRMVVINLSNTCCSPLTECRYFFCSKFNWNLYKLSSKNGKSPTISDLKLKCNEVKYLKNCFLHSHSPTPTQTTPFNISGEEKNSCMAPTPVSVMKLKTF